MNSVVRFFTVTALGSLLCALTIVVLWPTLRGPAGIAAGLALAVASMRLVEDYLAKRTPSVWTAIAMGTLSGATAWATLALLGD
jgi:hypothetical protein